MACIITGELSNENISLCNDKDNLSSKGAKTLLEELEKYMETKK
ncbi:hypothetical protein [Bacillus manliponensis]|nr:hypothetical protein [Bacillus manliponensis]